MPTRETNGGTPKLIASSADPDVRILRYGYAPHIRGAIHTHLQTVDVDKLIQQRDPHHVRSVFPEQAAQFAFVGIGTSPAGNDEMHARVRIESMCRGDQLFHALVRTQLAAEHDHELRIGATQNPARVGAAKIVRVVPDVMAVRHDHNLGARGKARPAPTSSSDASECR